jgi:mannose-6-phosphate isomerase-like protein (cupin superfamily)
MRRTKGEQMADSTVMKIDEMESVYGGAFKRARAELGVESLGMAVIDMPPNYEHYPEHDHTHDDQEEIYIVLRGGGELEIEGERHPLDSERMGRVGSAAKRKVWPGDEGIRLIILSGVPGGVYEAPDLSKLGEPDPLAAG